MKQNSNNLIIKGAVGTKRPDSMVLQKEFSWLSVPIPKAVHTHVKHMAGLSNMSLKEYVAWFLRTARPCTEKDLSQDTPVLTAHDPP